MNEGLHISPASSIWYTRAGDHVHHPVEVTLLYVFLDATRWFTVVLDGMSYTETDTADA